ncbi:MAG TPA: nuclear transport factor 2 family protein [Bradyrhizobium sp.]|nr:nuclear transport factor 2 family protein [Bradyrhizobium sp.]
MAERNSRELSLEQRIQALEDKLAIQQLIMSYPLVVDSGAVDVAASLWTADGIFDRGAADSEKHSGNFEGAYGLDAILKEIGGSALQAAREAGLCHVMTAPQITISGDNAVAIGYTLMVGRDGAEFRIRRPTANRWEIVRDGSEWKIKRRTLRLIDGSPAARELLGQAVQTKAP